MGIKGARLRLATFIFVTPKILNPMAIITRDPVHVISSITTADKRGEIVPSSFVDDKFHSICIQVQSLKSRALFPESTKGRVIAII